MSEKTLSVGLIGTGWGRIHCGTFRAAGCEIKALLGTDERKVAKVAQEEGVEIATTDASRLDGCDIIVIASPTASHLEYLRRFKHKAVFCEKPLSHRPLAHDELSSLSGFVNYAFPFLESTRAVEALLDEGRLGTVERALLRVGVRFDANKDAAAWFHDVASHPLSWLVHRFGRYSLETCHIGPSPTSLGAVFLNGPQQLDVSLYRLPSNGLHIELDLVGERAVVNLAGGFNPQTDWRFEPLRLDGQPVNGGEYDQGESIWYRANCRAVANFCAVLRGELSAQDALAAGSFDLRKAALIEQMLAPMLGSTPKHAETRRTDERS